MIYANAVLSALLRTSGPYALVPPSFFRPPMAIFSGTVSIGDVLDDIQIQKQRCSDRSHLHTGFANRARRMLAQEDMSAFLKRHNNAVFGGYSLGGAVAVIAAHLAMCESLCTVRGVYAWCTGGGGRQFCAGVRRDVERADVSHLVARHRP